MSWLSSWLHPNKGYQAAQQQLDKYFDQTKNYYDQANQATQPFVNQGQDAYAGLSDSMKALLDPQALQDKWMSGYKESEAAKNAEGMAQEHGLDAASSMGLMGSSAGLNAIQNGTSQIGAQDRQQYLDNLMQKYLAGTGIAQGIYGTGANAAGQQGQNAMNMGQNAMNMGQNAAQMAYGSTNAQGDLFGKLLGGAAGMFGGPLASGVAQGMGWQTKGGYNTPPNAWSTGGA